MRKLVLLVIICSSSNLFAQSLSREVVASSGDFFSAGGYTLSWTLGEPVSETFSTMDVQLTQGFQQPDLLTVTVSETQTGVFGVSVYPNPAKDIVNISWNTIEKGKIIVQIFDATGKKTLHNEIEAADKQCQIKFGEYAAGQYTMRLLSSDGKFSSTYQLSKIK